MLFFRITLCAFFALALPEAYAKKNSLLDLPLKYSFVSQSELTGLTTEMIWSLEPRETNPHRRRWVLDRKVDLNGFKSVKTKKGRFEVTANRLDAVTQLFTRKRRVWYQRMEDFPCSKKPNPLFATKAGIEITAKRAEKVWQEVLGRRRTGLGVRLKRVSSPNAVIARDLGYEEFKDWLNQVERDWIERISKGLRKAEWDYYWKKAKKQGLCKKGKKRAKLKPWDQLLDPLKGPEPKRSLARMPAKRYSGAFTIRATIDIAGKRLNGRFLLDSTSPFNIVSPSFLKRQGVFPFFVAIPGMKPKRIEWAGGSTLARAAILDSVTVGNFELPFKRFYLGDTQAFKPPKNVGACCDGVFGLEFFRQFAVEFDPGPEPHVEIWARNNFHLGYDTPWVEISTDRHGRVLTRCRARSGKKMSARGAHIGTGSVGGLRLHRSAFKDLGSPGPGRKFKVKCGAVEVGRSVVSSQDSSAAFRFPHMTLGPDVLFQTPTVLDLSHGRLWFPKLSSEERKHRQNRSGLRLAFEFKKGDRILKVKSIRSNKRTRGLLKAGLKSNMVLTDINNQSVSGFDQWQIDRILSGAKGNRVVLGWRTKRGPKSATLKLR